MIPWSKVRSMRRALWQKELSKVAATPEVPLPLFLFIY